MISGILHTKMESYICFLLQANNPYCELYRFVLARYNVILRQRPDYTGLNKVSH